ncbi:hypothetical protein F2P81_021272 [Scophthalmus maximus]|uniref:Uncharacterized protein n=1 Tax=Scophthalmus maximus TaxID=52904 RepID=A0A6A4S2R4_SCOMX|nr:hypothetical protein F2P81_021272 [Scophthalmus maximus]
MRCDHMNFECTYIIAYVVNLRSGDEIEGLESAAGILEVLRTSEGILEEEEDLNCYCIPTAVEGEAVECAGSCVIYNCVERLSNNNFNTLTPYECGGSGPPDLSWARARALH